MKSKGILLCWRWWRSSSSRLIQFNWWTRQNSNTLLYPPQCLDRVLEQKVGGNRSEETTSGKSGIFNLNTSVAYKKWARHEKDCIRWVVVRNRKCSGLSPSAILENHIPMAYDDDDSVPINTFVFRYSGVSISGFFSSPSSSPPPPSINSIDCLMNHFYSRIEPSL